MRDRVAELGLCNVAMLPGIPHEQVPALLAAADICLVPLRDVPLFSTFIPSKMFECLAAGKPVVGAVIGEAAQILREAGAWVVPPADSGALADAIRTLAADPPRRQAMGQQGRCYVEKYFDRGTLARLYRRLSSPRRESRRSFLVGGGRTIPRRLCTPRGGPPRAPDRGAGPQPDGGPCVAGNGARPIARGFDDGRRLDEAFADACREPWSARRRSAPAPVSTSW